MRKTNFKLLSKLQVGGCACVSGSFWRKIFSPIRVLWLFVALFSLGQLQRVELSPSVSFYWHDVFVVIWLAWFVGNGGFGFFLEILQKCLKTIRKNTFWQLFTLVLSLSLLVTLKFCFDNQTVVPFLYLGRLVAYSGFASSIYQLLRNSKNSYSKTYLKLQFLSVALIIAFLGLLQLIFIPDTRFLFLFGWDDHYYRLISTLFDPAFTGLVMLIGLIFSLKLSGKYPYLKILQGLLVVAIILTFSRATYLAGVVAFLVLLLSKKPNTHLNKKSFIVGTVALVGMILASSLALQFLKGGEGTKLLRTSTIGARVDNFWQFASATDLQTLSLGHGWFTFTPEVTKSNSPPNHSRVPDNILLMLVYSLGLPGALVVVWGFVYLIPKSNPELLAVIAAILIHAQFGNAVFQPFIWLYFWWGVAVFLEKTKV